VNGSEWRSPKALDQLQKGEKEEIEQLKDSLQKILRERKWSMDWQNPYQRMG
jgi:hypothetical protein